jgi:transcriptional regulator with XRE-family HTH domain
VSPERNPSESDFNAEAGRRLRAHIDALGIRQVDAAADMRVTKSHLGNWLRGAPIRPYQLYRFCRLRGVGMDWIFLGDPSGLPHKLANKLMEIPKQADPPEQANQE